MLWCMQRTNIYLETEQAQELDRVASAEGISRAELIRRLLDRGLRGGVGDLESDLAALSATAGAFADFDPIERDVDERSAHLDQMWHARP